MTSTRMRVAGLVAAVASFPFLLPTAAGAVAGDGYVDSSSDPESYPPLPGDCPGGQLWWQWVGDPNALPLAASSPYIVLPMTVPAGQVAVSEAITWDARGEQWSVEPFEKMRVEFYKDGAFLGATPFVTPDLPDDNPYAWSVSDLGSVLIDEDANRVVLAHASTFMATDGQENAFLPKSICVTSTPVEQPTTTLPPTTTVPPEAKPAVALTSDCTSATLTMTNAGDAPGEVAYGVGSEWTVVTVPPGATITQVVPLVEDETTYIEAWAGDQQVVAQLLTPDCEPPVVVLPQTETQQPAPQPELAFTGSDTARNTGIGAALLAAGLGMLAFGRRRSAEA